MKAISDGYSIRVVLSERNVRELLAEYERNPATATLTKRQGADKPYVIVTMEADEPHYAYRQERKAA